MTTRVEITSSLSSRTVQGGLGDVKSSRTHFSPLSDASNKSNESSVTGSLLIEETSTTHNKFVNRYNPGTRPRISPKPFSREKTSETKSFSVLAPKSPIDFKSPSDVPTQTSINISLSESGKKDDDGRQTRRFFSPSLQPSCEAEQSIKPEKDTYSGRKLYSSSWVPETKREEESKSTAYLEEWNKNTKHDVIVKSQVTSTKLEDSQSQPKDTFHVSVYKVPSPDETAEPKAVCSDEKPKSTVIGQSEDTASLRAQLRPKRRPVSAMFLNSINDPSADIPVAKDEKPVIRRPRPLSVDLTSKFETRDSSVVKKGNSSEEVKENIPLRKPSFNTSIQEEKAELRDKERSANTDMPISDANSGGTSGNSYSAFLDKDTAYSYGWGRKYYGGQTDGSAGENQDANKMEETCNQTSRHLTHDGNNISDNSVPGAGDLSISDESQVAPGTLQRRISLLLASSSLPGEGTESSTAKEDKGSPVVLRRLKVLTSDNVDSGRSRTSSQTLPSEVTKIYSSSPPSVELRYEKLVESATSVSKDHASVKDKLNQKTKGEALEENTTWAPKSSRHVDEKVDDSETTFRGRTTFISSEKMCDSTASITEGPGRNDKSADPPLKTVKATMFEQNIERHNAATVYSKPYQHIKSETASESLNTKRDYHSRSDHFDLGVNSILPNVKVDTASEICISDRQVGKAAPFTERMNRRGDIIENVDSHVPNILKNVPDNLSRQRIEPRYEITQTVGERALSESINIAPEDKAVTLRSQRSFHNKQKDADVHDFDAYPFDRPYSRLQRSKSEYRKRSTGNLPQSPTDKPLSRDYDVFLEKKYSFTSERSVLMKPQADFKIERTYQASKIRTTGKDASSQEKFEVSSLYKSREKHNFEIVDQQRASTKAVTSDSRVRELNKYPFTYDQTDYSKSTERDSPAKIWQPSLYTADKDPGSGKKTVKEETSDFMKSMLSKETEHMKKELTPSRPSSKESEYFKSNETLLETSTSDDRWSRGRAFVDTGSAKLNVDPLSVANETRGLLIDAREPKENVSRGFQYESKDNVRWPTMTETSSPDPKATYFAVTAMDKRKEIEEKEFDNYRTVTSFVDDFPVKTSTRVANPYADNTKQESQVPREDFEISSVSQYKKSVRSQNVAQEDLYAKLMEKTSEMSRTNVIDIDVISKFKESSSTEDRAPSYGESSSTTSFLKDHNKGHQNLSEGQQDATQCEPKTVFKPKAVDIDALMMDYKIGKAKERKTFDGIEGEEQRPMWSERSRSFRNSTEKGQKSKWIDPSMRGIDVDEGYQNKPKAPRPSSQEATSGWDEKEDVTFRYQKDSEEISSPEQSYGRKIGKTTEEKSVPTRVENTQNVLTVDSFLARRTRHERKSPSRMPQDPSDVLVGRSSRYTSTTRNVSEMSVDNQGTHSYRQTERKSTSVEQRQSRTVRPPATTRDIVGLLLENKDRSRRQQHTRQSVPAEPVEHPKSQTTSSQKEWMNSEYKESTERVISRQRPSLRESESRPERRNRSQLREKSDQQPRDQVKQCFSRTSTSIKDTDSLVQEADGRYGTWSQEQQPNEDRFVHDSPSHDTPTSQKLPPHSRLSSLSHTETDQHDSFTDTHDVSLDRSSMDLDSTDGTESTPSFQEAKADFSFMDQTSVLDSTVLKNRVQLSRKSQRRAPTQSQRKSRLLQSSSHLAVIEDSDSPWMYTDTTEENLEKNEECDEDEKPQRTSIQPQRMPMFPGMDPSALKAQLRKRQDQESSSETQVQPSKSPKSPLPQGTLGIKLLPTSKDKQDRGAEESPQWLKELKSKKRQSQYENQS